MDGLLDLRRELAKVEGLAGADVQLREAGEKIFLGWVGWAELKKKIGDLENVWRRCHDVGGLKPFDRRRRRRRELVEERAQWLGVVTGLDFADIRQVGHVEELSAEEGVAELRLGVDDAFNSCWTYAAPAGTGDHEGPALVPVGSSAEIAKVISIKIDKLRRVIAIRLDLRHGDDDGLGPKVHPKVGIGCVGIGSNDKLVLRSGN